MPAPSPDLVFQQAPLVGSPTHLVFGDDGSVVLEPVTVEVTAMLSSGLSVSAIAALPIRVDVVAVLLNSLIVSAAVTYDNRVTPWKDFRAAAPHDVAVPKLPHHEGSWGTSEIKRGGKEMQWTKAVNLLPEYREVYQPARAVRKRADAGWQLAMQHEQSTASAHQKGSPRTAGGAYRWQTGDGRRAESTSGMQTGIFHSLDEAAQWQCASSRRRSFDGPIGASLFRIGKQLVTLPWQMAGGAAPGSSTVPPVVVPPEVWNADLLFECPPLTGFPLHLVFGSHPCAGGSTLYILPARTYMTLHTLIAHRLPDMVEVPLYPGTTLNADEGSFAWSFTAFGSESLFSLLAPVDGATAAVPQQLQITLDGLSFVFVVESLRRSHQFGKRAVSISGRSVTALLGAPWTRESAFSNTSASNAQQLAAQALDLTGVALDWGITDWLVLANAWSHRGTPLAAVQAIAQAAGGYLQSHRSEPTLQVRHPYPLMFDGSSGGPWNWGLGAADVELAPDAIITSGIERKDGADINAVYVSGTTQGVLARVVRTGSAGNKLASLQTDALITHADAARQRGLRILGKAGPQYGISLELPILTGTSQPGVIDVGSLVQVNDATPWRSRVRSVSVQHASPRVRQTITLERHL